MTPPHIVLRASYTFHQPGCVPSRITLLKLYEPDGKFREYSTHLEATHEDGTIAYYHGDYFHPRGHADKEAAFNAAVESFKARLEKERDYQKDDKGEYNGKRLPVLEDSLAEMPEDIQYDHEDRPEIFRFHPVMDKTGQPMYVNTKYNVCLACINLKEYGSSRMIDTCNVHQALLLEKGETLGTKTQRSDGQKITPRLCEHFKRNLVPDFVIQTRTKMIKNKIAFNAKHYTGD